MLAIVSQDNIWIVSLLARPIGLTPRNATFAIVLILDFPLYIAAFVVMLIKRNSWERKSNPHPGEPHSLSHPSKGWIKYWNRNADQGAEQLNWGCVPLMLITLVTTFLIIMNFLSISPSRPLTSSVQLCYYAISNELDNIKVVTALQSKRIFIKRKVGFVLKRIVGTSPA